MSMSRFDVLVVGGGPAGSIASLVLARGGVDVALVDKSAFPRDKACGDVVGPRALQLLSDLELAPPIGRDVGDMLVVGPTGRRVRLPSADGLTYPGHGTAVARTVFDAMLHAAACDAGATPFVGRAQEPLEEEGRIVGYKLSTGESLYADFVIGADGATSEVAAAAGLVDPNSVLWGFAVRTYMPTGGRSPGHRLVGADSLARVPRLRLGLPRRAGRRQRRARHRDPVRSQGRRPRRSGTGRFPRGTCVPLVSSTTWFPRCRHAASVAGSRWGSSGPRRRGGGSFWLGDAAGLVNPMQGEGISQAMTSGRAAAAAILSKPEPRSRKLSIQACRRTPPVSSDRCRSARRHLSDGLVATAAVARLLTAAGVSDALSGGWAVFWNELLDGAPPNRHRSVANAVTHVGRAMTAPGTTGTWFKTSLR